MFHINKSSFLAQWLEHWPSVQKSPGSIPEAGNANVDYGLVCICTEISIFHFQIERSIFFYEVHIKCVGLVKIFTPPALDITHTHYHPSSNNWRNIFN